MELSNARNTPNGVFCKGFPRQWMKKDKTSSPDPLRSIVVTANFMRTDLPVPGFPLIRKDPARYSSKLGIADPREASRRCPL